MKTIQFSVTTLGEIQVPDNYSDEQIKALTEFQEQWFESTIIR